MNSKGEKTAYQFTSLSQSFSTRHRLPDLSEDEAYLLAFYGKYGLTMNRVLRNIDARLRPHEYANYERLIQLAQRNFDVFRKRNASVRSIENFLGPFTDEKKFKPGYVDRLHLKVGSQLRVTTATDATGATEKRSHLTYSLSSLINDIIYKYDEKFDDPDYLYRISRAKKKYLSIL